MRQKLWLCALLVGAAVLTGCSLHAEEKKIRDVEYTVVCTEDLPEELRKPNPFPLQDIMEKYHFTPDQMIVVDDMKLAWNMAHPLGVKVAFAGWGRREFPELAKEMQALCDFSFDTPEALEKFLFEED